MKKRILALIGVCVLTVGSIAGCGNGAKNTDTGAAQETDSTQTQPEAEESPAEEEEEGGVTGVADAWVDITEKEADELVMRLFKAPDGAEVLDWMKCEELGDPDKYLSPVVQLDFKLDDMFFQARAQQGAAEDADISGVFTEWTVGPEDVTLANWGGGNMQGKVYRSINDTGYIDMITWYDIEIGIAYELNVAAANLDGFDIQAVAEQMYTAANEPYGNMPDVPEQAETEDGVYSSYLLASAQDKIGTKNESGVFYSVVYNSLLSEDTLYIVGSMSYRNSAEQDPLFVSEDLSHVFTVDGNTEYQMRGGDTRPEIITSAEFADYLKELIDTGLYLEIVVEKGVVKSAAIAA